MKSILKLALLLLLPSFIEAQSLGEKIDSFKKLIAASKEDTTKAILLNKIGNIYSSSNTDTALLLYAQTLDLSRKAAFSTGEVKGLLGQGNVFSFTGDYPKALNAYLAALKISEQVNYSVATALLLMNIGNVYSYEGDYRQSINYALKAYGVAKNIDNGGIMSSTVNNLGVYYKHLNMPDSALVYIRLAYALGLKFNDPDVLASALINMGTDFLDKQQLDSAMPYYRRSIFFARQAGAVDNECEALIDIAEIFKRQGKSDSSLYYARKCLATGKVSGLTKNVLEASEFLATYFKQQGRFDSAFKYQEVSIAAKDSLYSQEKIKQFQNLSFAERQRQRDILEREAAYHASLRFYLLDAAILFLLVLAFIFWRNNRKNKKAKRLLQLQKEQIQTTLTDLKSTQSQLIQSEKMASLGELTAGIAHEIQNPLNFVNNFSEVNNELIDEMNIELDKGDIGEAKIISNDIKQNLEKINHHGKRADAIVKGMLQHSRSSTGVKELTDINALCDEYLRLSYHGLRAKDKSFNAEMKTDFDKAIGKINIVPQDIGRVLLNLYNNAFYEVNEKAKLRATGYEPRVIVRTKKTGNQVSINVSDNGNGIPQNIIDKIFQPFFTTKPTGSGTGLGLSLSYDIIKAHGGEIKVETKEGEGTGFTLILPAV
ncbi:MAG TPA: tetratricopeptide repeat protein [Puia sp.]|nr:tetratricopeptide repeat protein [Puia sp.]